LENTIKKFSKWRKFVKSGHTATEIVVPRYFTLLSGRYDKKVIGHWLQNSGSGLEEEVGYGKSPEWVEVDGHIVSKGVASLSRDPGPDLRSGSVLSLPYSSGTQLTYKRWIVIVF